MAKTSERACLLIADISGYTSYLQGVELDHARDVIADLVTAVVNPVRPTFRLNKLEGDAAFLYAPTENVDGSALLDMVEDSYFSFRRRVTSIERASTCKCGACALIPRLDLKMVVHQGTIAHQEMLGMEELVGPDVVLVHRMLKNDVENTAGTRAYVLLTDAVVNAMALEPELLDMTRYEDTFPDVGLQVTWIHDLDRAWRKEQARRRIYVAPDDSVFTMEHFVSGADVSHAWQYLTQADLRVKWELGYEDVVEYVEGRRGMGSETHCVHGEGVIKEEVIDWRPPRYVTYKGTFHTGEPFVVTDEVAETDGGVLLRKSLKPATAEDRSAVEEIMEGLTPLLHTWFPALEEMLTAELAAMPDIAEPELPQADEAARLATSVG